MTEVKRRGRPKKDTVETPVVADYRQSEEIHPVDYVINLLRSNPKTFILSLHVERALK